VRLFEIGFDGSFDVAGAMVWRSKVSVMGIRMGSSEDIGGSESDIVLRDLKGGNLAERSCAIGVKFLERGDH
jgi:hypothetical protein